MILINKPLIRYIPINRIIKHIPLVIWYTGSEVYLKAERHGKFPPFLVILATVLKCKHMHACCLRVNMAAVFSILGPVVH